MNKLFILLILYQLKHFLADYPLQGKYMLGKFKKFPDYIIPLMLHALVHGLFTYLIVSYFNFNLALKMAILDFMIHFIMDRIKASPNLLGRFKSLSKSEYLSLMYKETNGIWVPFYDDCMIDIKKAKKIIQSNTYFWWSLGLDQMIHHFTHYYIIYMVIN